MPPMARVFSCSRLAFFDTRRSGSTSVAAALADHTLFDSVGKVEGACCRRIFFSLDSSHLTCSWDTISFFSRSSLRHHSNCKVLLNALTTNAAYFTHRAFGHSAEVPVWAFPMSLSCRWT